MNMRILSPKGFVAPTLSLLALAGLACWLPMSLAAQTTPPMPDKDKTEGKSNAKSDKKNENKSEEKPDNKAGTKPDDKNPDQRANPVVIAGHPVPPGLHPGDKMDQNGH